MKKWGLASPSSVFSQRSKALRFGFLLKNLISIIDFTRNYAKDGIDIKRHSISVQFDAISC